MSKCREIQVAGVRGRGKSKKTWIEGIKEDMKKLNLKNSDTLDREEMEKENMGEPSNPCWHGKMDFITELNCFICFSICNTADWLQVLRCFTFTRNREHCVMSSLVDRFLALLTLQLNSSFKLLPDT